MDSNSFMTVFDGLSFLTSPIISLIFIFIILSLGIYAFSLFKANKSLNKKIQHEVKANEVSYNDSMALHHMIELAPFSYFAVNSSGEFIDVNQSFITMVGYPREALLQNVTLQDILSEKRMKVTPEFAIFQPFLKEEKSMHERYPNHSYRQSGELVLKNADGKKIDTYAVQTVLPDHMVETNKDKKAYAFLLNLKHEKREWRAVDALKKRLQRFFDKSAMGIAEIDRNGVVTEVNHALLKLVQAESHDDIKGTNFLKWIHPENRDYIEQRFSDLLEGAQPFPHTECKILGKDDIVVAIFANREKNESGKVTGLTIQLLNITEQKNLEVRFAQSQKMQAIGQLAGGIAHDFNNLLTAMIGFCDLLLQRHRPGDASFADIMQIQQNANRAANLVRQLLAFSRQQTLKPEVVDLTDVLTEISYLLRRLIGMNIELKMSLARDLATTKADKVQLEQVIINLAVNARDAMPEGGILELKTENIPASKNIHKKYKLMTPGDYVHLQVSDTGVGIPQKNLTRIFDPFFSTKEVGSGTGLGLSTVYGIVKQTGGFIFVDSEEGKGTRFDVFLPELKETEEKNKKAKQLEEKTVDLTGRGTILFVEDEDAVRLFGTRALRNKGYKILEAESGDRALNVISETKEKIDLMITDLVMPEMDGAELIKKVRETNPNLKIICISGYAEDAIRNRLDFDKMSIRFLAKPFSLKTLASVVKEAMDDDQ